MAHRGVPRPTGHIFFRQTAAGCRRRLCIADAGAGAFVLLAQALALDRRFVLWALQLCWSAAGALVLRVLLLAGAGPGSASAFRFAGAAAVLVLALALVGLLVLGRCFVWPVLAPWCWCRRWLWIGVSSCIVPGMTSCHVQNDNMSCQG